MKLHESVKNMNDRVIIYALIIGLTSGFSPVARGQQSDPVQLAPATMVGAPEGSTGGQSQSDVATANNPITPMNAIYFQNYYAPTAYGIPGSSNLLDLRGVLVSGRQLIRATLPISSGDDRNGNQQSGLGDFNVFDAIRVSPSASKDALAVGPMLVAPTATSRFLGLVEERAEHCRPPSLEVAVPVESAL
jgi:hypothetical protein